ncbi:MAG: 3'-5' exonuclease, partial [Fulvivirga sp.]|nr:3'-5' exonuclease [Fulvivirga sp.]
EDTWQRHPGDSNEGYVNVTFLENLEDQKWKEQVAEKLPKVLERLQDKGTALRDIAILVREHKEGKAVADLLAAYANNNHGSSYRYDVISNEALYLASSPAVRTVLFALKFIQDPTDKISIAELIFEYQRKIKGSPDNLNDWFNSISEKNYQKWLPQDFINQQHQLTSLPFYELIENLINIFEVNQIKGQFAYLQTFQDLVLKFSQNEKGDIASFLEWWEERASKESIKVADDLNAIRILTIHKAKGLQFKSVIIPYCDWLIDHKPSPPTLLWAKSHEKPFDTAHLPLKYKTDLNETLYAQEYQAERVKAHLDNLNILYVAFTRAIANLCVFAPANKKCIAKVLYATLDHPDFRLKEHWNSKENMFEYGQLVLQDQNGKAQADNNLTLETYNHFNWREKITIKQGGKGFAVDDEKRAKINYGILVHKLLSRIETLSDKDRVLRSIYYEEGLDEQQKEEVESFLNNLFKNKQAQRWFEEGWRVYNEIPILTPTDEYRPDRVITSANETIVIDYKTGIEKKEDRKQLGNYISLLGEMGYKNVKAFLWYLAQNNVVEVQ